jgi:hypothetical protein
MLSSQLRLGDVVYRSGFIELQNKIGLYVTAYNITTVAVTLYCCIQDK